MSTQRIKFTLYQLFALLMVLSFLIGSCTTTPTQAPTEPAPAAQQEPTSAPVASGEPIVVAFSGPLTGQFADEGVEEKNGFELAVDEWNAKGGVLGRPVEPLVIDDQVSVEPAVAGAQLAVQKNAVGVTGFFFSNVGIAARPTYTNNNIIFGPSGITAPDVISTAENPELVYRTIGLTAEIAELTVKYMKDVLGLKNVAAIHDRDDWGRSQAEMVCEAYKAPEYECLMLEGITVGETDFSGIGTKIIASGAESVYFGGHHQEQAGLINYLRENGWTGAYLGPDSLKVNYPALAGENAEGTIFIEGAGPTMIPAGQDFVKNYTDKFGHEPNTTSSLTTYVSTDLMLRAIEALGSPDDRAALVKWIREGSKDTAMGTITFDEMGEIAGFPWVVEEWQKDKWVVTATWNEQTQTFDATAPAAQQEPTSAPVASGEPIVVAFSGPLTGQFADEGVEEKNGFELAVDEWNAKGGVLGRPVEPLVIDDQVSVEPAVAGAQLAVQKNAVGVTGFFFSNVGIAARPTYTNNNIIFGPSGITAPDVISTAENPELVYRTIGLTAEIAELTVKYMKDVLGLKNVAAIHDRDDWGRSQAEMVCEAYKAPEYECLMLEGITVGESDFSGIGTKIIASGAESVYFGGHHQEQAGLINYLRENGWTGAYLGPDSLKVNYPALAGENAEGTIFIEGAGPTMIPAGQDFVKNYTDKFGHEPNTTSSLTTYVSTDLMLRAIEALGSPDDRAALVKWIREGSKDTAMGTITFDEMGEIAGFPWVVEEWQKDKWVVIATWNEQTQTFDATTNP